MNGLEKKPEWLRIADGVSYGGGFTQPIEDAAGVTRLIPRMLLTKGANTVFVPVAEENGTPLMLHVIQQRVDAACELLLSPPAPIPEPPPEPEPEPEPEPAPPDPDPDPDPPVPEPEP